MKKIVAVVLLLLCLFVGSVCYADLNDPITIDISRDTKLSDVLYALAYRSGCNIVINSKLDANIKGKIQGKNIYEVLNYLSLSNNFSYKITADNTIVVAPVDVFTDIRMFKLNYANLDDAQKMIALFVDVKKIALNPEMSSITVDGTQAQLDKVEAELAKMDMPTKQILLQIQMVELEKSNAEQLGVNYVMPSYNNSKFPINYANISWAVTTYAQDVISKGRVLARPSMVTPNGRKAVVKMVDQVPILTVNISDSGNRQTQVDYKDVGVTFVGTPRINVDEDGNETVTMLVHPIVSAITKWISSGDTKAPQIASREAETTVRVKSGETIVISGLIREEEIDALTKVPGFSELPILGGLFKYKDTSKVNGEVYIFVTPIILDKDNSITKQMLDRATKMSDTGSNSNG